MSKTYVTREMMPHETVTVGSNEMPVSKWMLSEIQRLKGKGIQAKIVFGKKGDTKNLGHGRVKKGAREQVCWIEY